MAIKQSALVQGCGRLCLADFGQHARKLGGGGNHGVVAGGDFPPAPVFLLFYPQPCGLDRTIDGVRARDVGTRPPTGLLIRIGLS